MTREEIQTAKQSMEQYVLFMQAPGQTKQLTPHLHVDFVPFATGQTRGLSTRVSMKQALLQQGFKGQGRTNTEWKVWMDHEKERLKEIAQAHNFEIISLGGGRKHMELPEYRAAAKELEVIQEQVAAANAEHEAILAENDSLRAEKKALQGTVQRLKAAEKVRVDFNTIQPEKTLTGAVKGVTVEQVKELKSVAMRGAAAEQQVRELKEENQQLQSRLPTVKEKLEEAEKQQKLVLRNQQLQVEVEYLTDSLEEERKFSSKLLERIGNVLDFLDQHLPEQFHHLLDKVKELLSIPEMQQPEQEQERNYTWGDMER